MDSGSTKECAYIKGELHLKLSYESVPILLHTYLCKHSSGES